MTSPPSRPTMEQYYDIKNLSGTESLAETASLTTYSTSPIRSHGSSFASQRTSSSRLLSTQDCNAEPEDLLTVFQASPLAYTDGNHELQPLGLLDFESERRSLTETLQDAVGDRIAISVETATTNLLGAFLSKGQGHVLHFSCHGHPKYLAVEDGWGHAQTLHVTDLKEWIRHGGQSLDFVFVSACHSRAVGDAFIEAGVPHVVCCHTVDMKEGAVHNIAAIEFEKAFYRALAHGRLLSEAFNLAVQETFCSPYLQHLDRLAEAQKFVLLPEQANHNVPIFFTSRSRSLQRNRPVARKRPPHCAVFDQPPEIFLGRELDMYRVISALKGSRLVRVSGPRGVGKSALLKACCRYVSERSHIFAYDDVLWAPMASEQQESTIYACFSKLFETFRDNSDIHSPFAQVRDEGIVYAHKIIRHFRGRRSLLVFDARGPIMTEKLSLFLEELLRQANHVKVIVVHHPKARITSEKMPSAETDIELPALDFSSTAMMFGWMNQYVKERKHPEVGNPKEFVDLVNPEGLLQVSDCFSKRIFSIIGEGIPQRIQNAARDMTVTEYYNLIEIAKKTRGGNLRSRAALEKKGAELNEQIQLAVEEEDFDRAQELQDDLNDLDLLREEFPSLTTLEAMLVEVSTDFEFAKRSKAWKDAGVLKKERDVLETKIQTERAEMNALGIDYPVDMSEECFESQVPQSSEVSISTAGTAGIRDTIKGLESAFQKAMDTNNFQKANLIDKELSHLRKQRTSIPDSTQLSDEIFELKRQLKEAKMDHKYHEAETIYARLECLQQRLGLDGKENPQVEAGPTRSRRTDPPCLPAISDPLNQQEEEESGYEKLRPSIDYEELRPSMQHTPMQPPGTRGDSPSLRRSSRAKYEAANLAPREYVALHDPGAHDVSDTDESEEDQKQKKQTQPGAFRVAGVNGETSQDEDELTITSLDGEIPMAFLVDDETTAHIRAEQQLLSESIQHIRERIGSAHEDTSPGLGSAAARNNEDERVDPRLVQDVSEEARAARLEQRLVQDESEEARVNRLVQESLSSLIAGSSLVPAEPVIAEDNEAGAQRMQAPTSAPSEARRDGRRRRFWRRLRHSFPKK